MTTHQFKLLCAAYNGISVYGLATEGADAGDDKLLFLVQSNQRPPTLASYSWTIVSKVRVSAIYDISQSQDDNLCSVDTDGVFTYIGSKVVKAPSQTPGLGGVQYSKSHPNPNNSSTGDGGWKTIDFNSAYTWPQKSSFSTLFLANKTPVHAYRGSSPSIVQFGYLDENLQMTTATAQSWSFDASRYGTLYNVNYLNNYLYFLSGNQTSSPDVVNLNLLKVPFNFPNMTQQTPQQPYDVSVMNNCFNENGRSGIFANSYFIICNNTLSRVGSFDLNSASRMDLPRDITNPPEDPIEIFLPVGGQNLELAFALVQTKFEGGNNNANRTATLRTLNLSGGAAGLWQRWDFQVNVTEAASNKTLPANGPPNSSSSTPVGLIVGIVAALGVALTIAFYFGYYRRVVLKRRGEKEEKRKKDSTGLDNAKYIAETPSDLQKRPYNSLYDDPLRSSAINTMTISTPVSTPMSTHITSQPFSMYSSAPITTTVLADPLLQAQMQQQFKFTAHPRPNFVTSTAGTEEQQHNMTGQCNSGAHNNNINNDIDNSNHNTSQSPPSIPTRSRPSTNNVPMNNPHALVSEVLSSVPIRSPHTPISATMSSVFSARDIPANWDKPVVHNPHTEPAL